MSSTLKRVDWYSQRLRGGWGRPGGSSSESRGRGLFVAGLKLPPALEELGLIDGYELAV